MTIHCQAKNPTGAVVFDTTMPDRSYKRGLLSQAVNHIAATGGIIRFQEIGANGWSLYRVTAGRAVGVQDNSIEWGE